MTRKGDNMYEHILVPIDGSATSTRGLEEAIKLARLASSTLRLMYMTDLTHFASGWESGAVLLNDILPLMEREGKRVLEQARDLAVQAGVPAETVLVNGLSSRLVDAVVEQVRAWHADLIVMGTHGRRGIGRLMLGSDAESVLRSAPVPVLLVPAARVVPV